MRIIDNINTLLGDDLKQSLRSKSRVKIAASCFSMYAYKALKNELGRIQGLEFIFTAPTFVPNVVSDAIRKERREFFLPKLDRERSLYGSEFEIRLQNKLTQRAVAGECVEWIRGKAVFRSNRTKSPMQQFACVQWSDRDQDHAEVYMPYPAKPGEGLRDDVQRIERIRTLRADIEKCTIKLRKETQFNRKVPINAAMRSLKQELSVLTKPLKELEKLKMMG